MRWLLMAGLAVGTTLYFAAPPEGFAAPPGGVRAGGGVGRFAGGSITGPAPVGASGPAPIHGTGSLLNPTVPGARVTGFRGGAFVNPSPYGTPAAYGSRSPYGNTRRNERSRTRYAFFLTPYAYPYLGYDDSSYVGFDYGMSGAYGPPGPMDPAAQDLAAGQDALGRQMEQLTAEVEQLRAQQASPVAPASAQPENSQPVVPLTVVLTNGQQLQVNSYAVMDGVFWDFSKQPARKIPLSAINIDASAQATQQAGGEFPDLTSR